MRLFIAYQVYWHEGPPTASSDVILHDGAVGLEDIRCMERGLADTRYGAARVVITNIVNLDKLE